MNILMIGGYGYNDVGDEAQPHAILDNITNIYGTSHEIVMLSPCPEFTEQYHGVTSEKDICVLINNQKEAETIDDALYRDFYSIMRAAQAFAQGQREGVRPDVLKIFDRIMWADVVINSGGGNINSIMVEELLRRTAIHRIAKLFDKKVIVSNQTIGPFYNNRDKEHVRITFDQLDLLTFRDSKTSMKRCREIGVMNEHLYDTADDAISLYGIPKKEAQVKIEKDLGVGWANLTVDMTIGVNLKASLNSFKGEGRSSSLEKEIQNMVHIVEYLLSNYSCKIAFVSTDYCPGCDDRVYMRQIRDQLSDKWLSHTAILEEVYTDYELKGILGCFDAVIGSRYHFIVFAAGNYVPFLGIASGEYQRTKLEGIANLAEVPSCYFPGDLEFTEPREIFSSIDYVLNNRFDVHEKLLAVVPILIEKSKMSVKQIGQYV